MIHNFESCNQSISQSINCSWKTKVQQVMDNNQSIFLRMSTTILLILTHFGMKYKISFCELSVAFCRAYISPLTRRSSKSSPASVQWWHRWCWESDKSAKNDPNQEETRPSRRKLRRWLEKRCASETLSTLGWRHCWARRIRWIELTLCRTLRWISRLERVSALRGGRRVWKSPRSDPMVELEND